MTPLSRLLCALGCVPCGEAPSPIADANAARRRAEVAMANEELDEARVQIDVPMTAVQFVQRFPDKQWMMPGLKGPTFWLARTGSHWLFFLADSGHVAKS